jgi:hypothetical protein
MAAVFSGFFCLTTAVQAMTEPDLTAQRYQQVKQTGLDKAQLNY